MRYLFPASRDTLCETPVLRKVPYERSTWRVAGLLLCPWSSTSMPSPPPSPALLRAGHASPQGALSEVPEVEVIALLGGRASGNAKQRMREAEGCSAAGQVREASRRGWGSGLACRGAVGSRPSAEGEGGRSFWAEKRPFLGGHRKQW